VQHVPQSTPDDRLIVGNEDAANGSVSVDNPAAPQHQQSYIERAAEGYVT
jgi:hypothetical protein